MWDHNQINNRTFGIKQLPYKHSIKCPITDKIPDSPNYDQCIYIESVDHFILKCIKYKQQRKKLFHKLRKINYRYKYPKFQTIKYRLFPYLLNKNDIFKQILIWKEILSHTKETNRFNNVYHIDLNKI